MLELKLIFSCGAPVATNKERRPSEARERRGRKTLERPGMPVATSKERRPSEARERRGRETLERPGVTAYQVGMEPDPYAGFPRFHRGFREESLFREDSRGVD